MESSTAQVGPAVLPPGHHESSLGRGPLPRRHRLRGARGGAGTARPGAAGARAAGHGQRQVAETGPGGKPWEKASKMDGKPMETYGKPEGN